VSDSIKLSSPATHEFWEIPVLFEDEHLLALDKPPALLTSPDRSDPARPNLMKLLHTGIAQGKPWARARGLAYLAAAHRLDFETGGVLLLAKSRPVLVALANLFGSEKPIRTYVALAHGSPADRFEIDARLASHPGKPGLMRVDPKHGKHARTQFEVTERFGGCAMLRCRPLTGRTHQIRLHLRHAGHPVVGDALYGGHPLLLSRLKPVYRLKPDRTERPLISQPALHAEQLELVHPVTGATVAITAPWPKDLMVALKYLRRYAAAGGGDTRALD
jgi:23S rRNA pseudouridine1911/1915/1917 synthase